MYIITVGLNYKTAPVEIRERLSFQEAELIAAMLTLKKRKSILENVIVSTCNRTEIYAVVDQLHTGRYYIKEFLAEWFHIEREQFESHLYIYENQKAVEHLFNVSCGLDSMVIGETQILGQVRSSFSKHKKQIRWAPSLTNFLNKRLPWRKSPYRDGYFFKCRFCQLCRC